MKSIEFVLVNGDNNWDESHDFTKTSKPLRFGLLLVSLRKKLKLIFTFLLSSIVYQILS